MQIPPSTVIVPTPAKGALPVVRIVSGDPQNLPLGVLLQASVTQVTPREATLTVNGQSLVVRPPAGLKAGEKFVVRVPAGGASLELIGRTDTPAPGRSSVLDTLVDSRLGSANTERGVNTVTSKQASQGSRDVAAQPQTTSTIARVDVIASQGRGLYTVRIDGQNFVAESAEPLVPGGRYLLLVDRPQSREIVRVEPGIARAASESSSRAATNPVPATAVGNTSASPILTTPTQITTSPSLAIPTQVSSATATSPGATTAAPNPGVPTLSLTPPASPPTNALNSGVSDSDPAPGKDATRNPVTNTVLPTAAGQTQTSTDASRVASPRIAIAPLTTLESPDTQAPRQASASVPLVRTVILRPIPEGLDLSHLISTTILKTNPKPADLGQVITPLLQELSSVKQPPEAVMASDQVRRTLESILAEPGKPPTAEQLKALVENGGLLYEAKIARDPEASGKAEQDLKGGLLTLLKTMSPVLSESLPLPQSRVALDGIEAQQALNVIAQENRQPYVFQVPFPDGDRWRSVNVSVDPESSKSESPTARGGFRVLLNVELTSLGETWVDAATTPGRLFAVLYVSSEEARTRVSGELADLKQELREQGFGEVLLDIRSAEDLPAKQRARTNAMKATRPEGMSFLDVKV